MKFFINKMAEMKTSELKKFANDCAVASNKAYKAGNYEWSEYFNALMHTAILEYQAR